MGHANISITLDRYGHLVPGSEEEAASLLDSYLATQRERAEEQSRAAAPRDNRGIMVHISSGTGGTSRNRNPCDQAILRLVKSGTMWIIVFTVVYVL